MNVFQIIHRTKTIFFLSYFHWIIHIQVQLKRFYVTLLCSPESWVLRSKHNKPIMTFSFVYYWSMHLFLVQMSGNHGTRCCIGWCLQPIDIKFNAIKKVGAQGLDSAGGAIMPISHCFLTFLFLPTLAQTRLNHKRSLTIKTDVAGQCNVDLFQCNPMRWHSSPHPLIKPCWLFTRPVFQSCYPGIHFWRAKRSSISPGLDYWWARPPPHFHPGKKYLKGVKSPF